MTIVGIAVAVVLVMLVFAFLYCFMPASGTGRHALGVDSRVHLPKGDFGEVGEDVHVEIGEPLVGQHGVGPDVYDDLPCDFRGARPYLEDFWKKADQTTEFPAVSWFDDGEYESVSGQLELVA
ncbi:hypothetical protein [Amycolatopsis sp. NPDC051061]|uniref:hypothetical protein n=1 Tax=Amycolatopsis sp. NPDC051061 TaxID=3155042 RepID=UPI00342C46C9